MIHELYMAIDFLNTKYDPLEVQLKFAIPKGFPNALQITANVYDEAFEVIYKVSQNVTYAIMLDPSEQYGLIQSLVAELDKAMHKVHKEKRGFADVVLYVAELRRFFDGTAACKNVWEDIKYDLDKRTISLRLKNVDGLGDIIQDILSKNLPAGFETGLVWIE
jgi:hypothetical protein